MEKPIKKLLCATCGKEFSKPALLRRHEAVHMSEKEFKCIDCSQAFTQNSSLQRHIKQKHHGERAYKCTLCEQSFTQNCNLKQHMQRTHSKCDKSNRFPCNMCTCLFQTKGALHRHQTMCHKQMTNNVISAIDDYSLPDDPDLLAQNVLTQLKNLQHDLNLNNDESFGKIEELVTETQVPTLVDAAATEIVTLEDRLNPEKLPTLFTVAAVQRQPDKPRHYVCEFCAMEFHKSYDLIRHRRSHTKKRPYPCNICSESFATTTKLQEHKRKHILDEKTGMFAKQYLCMQCAQKFDSIRKLDDHSLSAHSGENRVEYRCTECSATFDTKKSFAAHKHAETDEDLTMLESLIAEPIFLGNKHNVEEQKCVSLKCPTCRKDFTNENDLKEHNHMHKGQPRFQCEDCGSYYGSISALNYHQKVHISYKSFSCPICPKKYFLSKAQLEQHQNHMHQQERNYQCAYCEAKFKTSGHCKSHMKTHIRNLLNGTEEKPKINLNEHNNNNVANLASAANKDKPKFIALQLSSSFGKSMHRNITVEPLESTTKLSATQAGKLPKNVCTFCEKSFKKPSDLQRHLRTHTQEKPFTCEICSKSFALKATLNEHRLIHDPTRIAAFTCQVCGKDYASQKTLNIHLRLHTNLHPFKCEFCGKTFRTSGHRLAHLKAKKSCMQQVDEC